MIKMKAIVLFFCIVSCAIANVSVYFSPDGGCDKALIAEIDKCTSTADIAIYSINEPGIVDSIFNAAKRGVQFRLVCDKTEAGGKNSATKKFQKSNLPIHIQHGTGGGIMHIKMSILDKKIVTLGSFNYTGRATTKNDEVEAVIDDPGVVSACQNKFDDMWTHPPKEHKHRK